MLARDHYMVAPLALERSTCHDLAPLIQGAVLNVRNLNAPSSVVVTLPFHLPLQGLLLITPLRLVAVVLAIARQFLLLLHAVNLCLGATLILRQYARTIVRALLRLVVVVL